MKKILFFILLFGLSIPMMAQVTVQGTVRSSRDRGTLPGVSIQVKGTTTGTVTDLKGHYSINVPANATLVFSFVGFKSQEKAVNNRSTINVFLEPQSLGLNQVVVVGYGAERKRVLTGATVQVSGAKIAKLNTVSTLGALQGSTPGVQLTKKNGQPGSGYIVHIRGMGTIGNSTPLYIVDGVIVGSIDDLSPSDIASVSVLKGPMAAIYGSRGANGVILVTTKHGKRNEKPTITYDAYYGWQNVYRKANTLNAQQYLMIINEGMVNGGQLPYDITKLAASLNGNANGKLVPLVPNAAAILNGTDKGTNWMQAITNANAPVESHTLNITGGSERSTYSFGLSYLIRNGILGKPVASNYNRYTLRLNSRHILLMNKNKRSLWEIGENLTYSYSKSHGVGQGNVYWNDIYAMETANPFLPIYGYKGLYSYAIPWDHLQNNPIALMVYDRGYNESKSYNLTASVYTKISPIKGLDFTSRFSAPFGESSYRSFTPKYDLGSVSDTVTAVGSSTNTTAQNMYEGFNWIWNNTLSYKFKVNQDHSFTVLVGESAEKDGLGSWINGQNTGNIFNSFEYGYLSNAPTINTANTVLQGEPYGEHQILSYFGRLNYSYKGTYLFSGVIRSDGSSNFAPGHRWGTFPALSAGWIITNESFMKSTQSWLDFLKIRAAWGKNGNESISNFQYLSTIQTGGSGAGNYYSYGDKTTQSPAAYPNILPNPNVTWETSTQTDIGLDATFLKSRLTLNFDWYNKTTDGWLVQVPVPAVDGTNPAYVNGGNILNRGYEVDVAWHDQIGQLHYSVSANFAYNHNEVTKIKGGGIIYGQGNFYGSSSGSWYVAAVGMPAGCFYGFKTDGIFQNEAQILAYKNKKGQLIQPDAVPGDIKYVDVNGDGTISEADRTNIGNSHPPYTFGATINLSYKGFDFTCLGTGVAGNKVVQATDWAGLNDPLNNFTTGILQRWHGDGTSNTFPRVSLVGNLNNERFSDMWLQSGSYFRISNLTLGYNFKYLWKEMPLQEARLYVTIQNAYTFTKYRGMDPVVGYAPDAWSQGIDLGSYPEPRTVLLGVDLKF